MIEWLKIIFAVATGFWGGVMYAREVYRPLVEWARRQVGQNDQQ